MTEIGDGFCNAIGERGGGAKRVPPIGLADAAASAACATGNAVNT